MSGDYEVPDGWTPTPCNEIAPAATRTVMGTHLAGPAVPSDDVLKNAREAAALAIDTVQEPVPELEYVIAQCISAADMYTKRFPERSKTMDLLLVVYGW